MKNAKLQKKFQKVCKKLHGNSTHPAALKICVGDAAPIGDLCGLLHKGEFGTNREF